MSLLGSQQLQKMMLILQMAGRNSAKNKTWSQLSAVVSMMGLRRLPPSQPHVISAFLQRGARAGGRNKSRKLLAACTAAPPLWQACHLFSYHTLANLSLSEKAAYYTRDKEKNQPNYILWAFDGPDDLKVRM